LLIPFLFPFPLTSLTLYHACNTLYIPQWFLTFIWGLRIWGVMDRGCGRMSFSLLYKFSSARTMENATYSNLRQRHRKCDNLCISWLMRQVFCRRKATMANSDASRLIHLSWLPKLLTSWPNPSVLYIMGETSKILGPKCGKISFLFIFIILSFLFSPCYQSTFTAQPPPSTSSPPHPHLQPRSHH